MQFIKGGPDIPELLLQAQEDGQVVFFCGAGISYSAGLPGFRGMVDRIYAVLGTERTPIENQAYSRKQYDATLDLLERRIPGQRLAVRNTLIEILKPKLSCEGALDIHSALLQLARSRDNTVRLVTTNFDRIFQHLTRQIKAPILTYQGPLLPVPKNSRWNGIVHLHGLLPEALNEIALHRLVLTSGDFGLAYLTERWAARFVSELFRNYVICFVGYSINDPVLRYMMDALAADRLLGESTPNAYAFGAFKPGQELVKHAEWEAKGVTPILYSVSAGHADHSALRCTLKEWAATYRDGVRGKERIVTEYATARPLASTRQDNFVGRMLWALSHDSGLPAKRFADFEPVPPLDWLGPLSDNRYCQAHLPNFGVSPGPKHDDTLAFSLIRRPAPYTHAPWMMLTDGGSSSLWDDVMCHLARWLVRHLDDPVLVLWIVKHGAHLHDRFASMVENCLCEFTRLEREGKIEDLERIRSRAPRAVPGPVMRTIWRLLLIRRVRSSSSDHRIYRWANRFNSDGLTATLRMELRELLAPRVSLREPFRWPQQGDRPSTPTRVRDFFDWELVFSTDHIRSLLNNTMESEAWRIALPQFLDDSQQLLRDALDLRRELGETDELSDHSCWDLPSISPHWQNRGFREWVILIEILRDAWLATRRSDPPRALRVAREWWLRPYPTFKRLALFAATHDDVALNGEWANWLLADDGWWLWSVETKREVMRLLVLQGANLPVGARALLEKGILTGPPRRMFRNEVNPEEWEELVAHSVWLRLAKLASNSDVLSDEAIAHFESLKASHPHWQIEADERDEFSHWISGTGDPGHESRRRRVRAPRRRRELVEWLQRPRPTAPFYEDDWHEVCRENFSAAACALCALAQKDQWPAERWREALQAWSDERLLGRSWRYIAPLLERMPEGTLFTIADSATWWLEATSKVIAGREDVLLSLCGRFLAMVYQEGVETDRPVARAINHPVGHVTQALLHYWYRLRPEDGQGLPDHLKQIFTMLCDTKISQHRHARVLLSANVIALFRVDCDWAVAHVLPLFRWQCSAVDARAAWEGFLWSPRLHQPLLAAFKGDFLETAHRYAELGESGRQYAMIFTYAALDSANIFTDAELREAINALPQEGLQESAQTLVRALDGTVEQREEYWKNRVCHFWQAIWPKSIRLRSAEMATQLAQLAIVAGEAFPSALRTVHDWLQPIAHPGHVVRLLHESKLCGRYPQDALTLLNAIIGDPMWIPPEFDKCMQAIVDSWPDAERDSRYQRLTEHARRHGQK